MCALRISTFRLLGNCVTLNMIQQHSWHDVKYDEIERLIPQLASQSQDLPVVDEESRFRIGRSKIPCDPPMKGNFKIINKKCINYSCLIIRVICC